jgi:putative redox protein
MTQPPGTAHRSVTLVRTASGEYDAINSRGTRLALGTGDSDRFTPVELLLVAIAGCSAVDVDLITSRRAEPTLFEVTSAGEKLRDDKGNHMGDLTVTFRLRFPRRAGRRPGPRDAAEGDRPVPRSAVHGVADRSTRDSVTMTTA